MSDYIEREAALAYPIRKDKCDRKHANKHFIFGIESVIEFVENLPAADVAPVRHGMTGNEYQRLALRTASGIEQYDLTLNGVMGLNGEAGECIDIVKKHLFQGHPLDTDKLVDELGDVLWYVAITADGIGVPLEDIMQHNIDKLRKRYPEGFDAERSIHREGERGNNGFESTGR